MSIGLTGAIIDSAINYQTPSNAFSITLNNGDWHVILDPSAGLITGTIIMPPGPLNGQVINIRSSQSIGTLTINGNTGQSIKGYTAGAIALGGIVEGTFLAANSTWYF